MAQFWPAFQPWRKRKLPADMIFETPRMLSAPTFMPPEGRAPHAASWYAASSGEIPTYQPLKGHCRADIAIIGLVVWGLV